jgi:hypothetical protein
VVNTVGVDDIDATIAKAEEAERRWFKEKMPFREWPGSPISLTHRRGGIYRRTTAA